MKKVSDLIGWELDYWTAKAEGYFLRRVDIEDIHEQKIYRQPDVIQHGWLVFDKPPSNSILIGSIPDRENSYFNVKKYSPSAKWADGGPIIEREGISIDALWGISGNLPVRLWCAERNGVHCQSGTTPLVAAMRCFVASKFGDEVDDSQTHHI